MEDVRKIKFKRGCEEWLYLKKNSVKESTYLNYKFKIEKHLIPDLGDKTFDEIVDIDMNEYLIRKKKEYKNKDIIIILKSVLRFIKRKYKIEFDLDFNGGPKDYSNEIEVFNEKERQNLQRYYLKNNLYRDMGVLISLYSGLRIGEVCGLKWEDIDFENKIIEIKRTVQRVYFGRKQTKVIVTVPKTRKSLRKIPISKVLLKKLMPISKNYSPHAYILSRKGRKMYGANSLQIYI